MSETDDRADHPHRAQLTFASEHVEPILAGRKTATIRYEIDSHGALRVGRRFDLVDESGERFASAIVDDRGVVSAETIVEKGVEGHDDYQDLGAFYEQMREYYPRAELGPTTLFEIIHWQGGELWV